MGPMFDLSFISSLPTMWEDFLIGELGKGSGKDTPMLRRSIVGILGMEATTGATTLMRGLPTTDFLAGVRIGDLAGTRPADKELLSVLISPGTTYFLQVRTLGIAFQEQRLAMQQQ
jgi:hypothetical protein